MASLILFPIGLVVGVITEAIAIEAPIREVRDRSNRLAIVSLATGLLFAATPLVIGVDWVLPAYLWFVAVTVTLTLTDLDDKLIPNRILFPGTAVALVLLYGGALIEGGALLRPVLGGGAYYLLLLVLALVGPSGGMGGGDVKLGFLLGAFTAYPSWQVMIVSVLLAFILGGLISLLLILTRLRDRKEAIAFGPFLIIGAYAALAWGATIADWYLGG
jgi:leader peptidase (prepilin peptidase) / N-methyltransferase